MAWRPSHFHFIISAKRFRQLVTEVFPEDDPHLDSDAVFGVREDLILAYKEIDDLRALPDDLSVGKEVSLPFYKVDFDFILIPLKD
jgi:Protocatechuate 3,4-dioxygenase beta subunit